MSKRCANLSICWVPTFSDAQALKAEMQKVDKSQLKEKQTLESAAKAKLAQLVPPNERMFYQQSAQYYFYYATQCKFHAGGKRWDNWNKVMKPNYIQAQQIEKKAIQDDKGVLRDIGWWENVDVHSDRPVMDTCLAALQLMVYYRYLPTTSKEAVQVEAEIGAVSTDTDDVQVDIGNL